MRRVFIASAIVAGMIAAGPVAAGTTATTDDEARHQRASAHEQDRGQRMEALHLRCGVGVVDEERVVACGWQQARHPEFASYQLWRSDRERREVVFSTDDRARTRFIDRDADPREQAFYVLVILDAEGEMIGRSNVAAVHGHQRPHRPAPRPLSLLPLR